MAPHDVYPCAGNDRWLAIAVTNDDEWIALAHAIGRPDLAGDPRFAGAAGRLDREDELDAIVSTWTRTRDPAAAMHELQAAGVPAGVVMSTEDQAADPHFAARGFAVEIDHPEVGRRSVAGIPAKFSRMPELAYSPAPCLGEHNAEIFGGLLGLSAAEIEQLVSQEVIF
jgi:crotonobetainyl-CoA:carnitine CoA-transferase CaiB-like acyl-CoA transferase